VNGKNPSLLCLVLLFLISSTIAYTSLSPANLHTRLVNKDTLLILDVREWSEYTAGHLAEPAASSAAARCRQRRFH
jgi:hypothetical protein